MVGSERQNPERIKRILTEYTPRVGAQRAILESFGSKDLQIAIDSLTGTQNRDLAILLVEGIAEPKKKWTQASKTVALEVFSRINFLELSDHSLTSVRFHYANAVRRQNRFSDPLETVETLFTMGNILIPHIGLSNDIHKVTTVWNMVVANRPSPRWDSLKVEAKRMTACLGLIFIETHSKVDAEKDPTYILPAFENQPDMSINSALTAVLERPASSWDLQRIQRRQLIYLHHNRNLGNITMRETSEVTGFSIDTVKRDIPWLQDNGLMHVRPKELGTSANVIRKRRMVARHVDKSSKDIERLTGLSQADIANARAWLATQGIVRRKPPKSSGKIYEA